MSTSEPPPPARFLSALSRARAALAAVLHSPLLRNGYALIMSAGLTSVLGLAFWAMAARLYTPEQVGVGAALISTMLTLGNISQLNLGNLLNRYLPSSGAGARRLVVAAYAVAATTATLLSTLAVVFISHFVAELSFLREQPLSAVAFVVATAAWTLFALQDSVLAGLRRATVVPIENTLFSTAKLLLLALFAGSSLIGSGLYAAWVLPLPLLLALINWLIFFRLLPQHGIGGGTVPDRRAIARYFGWDYVGTLASMTAMGIAPLVVLHYSSAVDLAVYYISWEIAYSVYLISRSMGISLLAEVAFDRSRLHRLAIDAMIYTMAPLAMAVALLLVGASLLLPLLGAQYSESSPAMLRLLAVSCLPWSLVTLMLAVARATGRTQVVAIAQVATLTIVLGLGIPLVIAYGAAGMAAAWLIAHCVIATGLIADLSSRLGPAGRIDLVLRFLSALARLWSAVSPRKRTQSSPPLETCIAGFCATMGLTAPDARAVREFRRESDVRTGIFETAGPDVDRLVFKTSTSPEGRAALTRHITRSQSIAGEPALTGLDFTLSRIIASHTHPSAVSLVERAWMGDDGRATLAVHGRHFPALARAMGAISEMHGRTATMRSIDEAWMHHWIDRGCDAVMSSRSFLMGDIARAEALRAFQKQQRQFWSGRALPLGLGHGDFSPGNLLFVNGKDKSDIRLSAIIDWEAASSDSPPGLDEIFLLLTARAQRSGEELGFAVRHLLEDPSLSPEEVQPMMASRAAMDAAYGSFMDPAVLRALCGLAWWRHIAGNVTKSSRFTGNALWVAINIDRVLAWYGDSTAGKERMPAAGWLRRTKGRPPLTTAYPAIVDRAGKG
jgi:O-antigen/teichoic acid export membrane protein